MSGSVCKKCCISRVEVQLIQRMLSIAPNSLWIKCSALCVRCRGTLKRKRYCCQISVLTSGTASWLDWKDFSTRTRSSGTHLADDSKPLCGKFGLALSIKRQMKNTGGLSRHTTISTTLTAPEEEEEGEKKERPDNSLLSKSLFGAHLFCLCFPAT